MRPLRLFTVFHGNLDFSALPDADLPLVISRCYWPLLALAEKARLPLGIEMPERGTPLEIGKGRVLREGSKVAILSYGTRLADALSAADELAARGLPTTVADARFAKPFDQKLVRRLAREHEVLVTVEEGSIGGFAAQVMQFMAQDGLLENGLKFRPLTLPDYFIDHDKPANQVALAGLDAAGIVASVLGALGRGQETLERPARA